MTAYDIKSLKELKLFINSDLYRYLTSTSLKAWLRGWYIAGFRYTFFLRCCRYFGVKNFIYKPLFLLCRIALRHYSVKYGFQIPWKADIGPGLCIGHYGPIIINPSAKIGTNCNITVGVLLGLNFKVDEQGKSHGAEYPEIGDRVALSNSAKIIGGVKVGSDSLIGVNSLVTNDIPPHSVAIGSPAKVISQRGSSAFVGSFHPWTLNNRFN